VRSQDRLQRLLCERDGLLPIPVDAHLVQFQDRDVGQLLAEVVDDVEVSGAAAAHVDLRDVVHVDVVPGKEGAVLLDDVLRCDARDGGHGIILAHPERDALVDEGLALVVAEGLAAGGLGRRTLRGSAWESREAYMSRI